MLRRSGEKKPIGIRPAALTAAAVLLFLLLFLGVGALERTSGVALTDDPAGDYDILALEAGGSGVWLAARGEDHSLLMKLGSDGRPVLSREVPSGVNWVALRGGRLFFREDGGTCALVGCDLNTLEEVSRLELPWSAEDLFLFDCGSDGTAYCVLSRDKAVLRSFDGGEQTKTLPGEAAFLRAGDTLCLAAGGNLCLGASPADLRTVPCPAAPIGLLEDDLLLDSDGVVQAVEGSSLTARFRCPYPVFGALSFCSDGEKGLILSAGGGEVHRYGPTGTLLGTCQLEASPLAVCRKGAVLRKNGKLCFAAFTFAEPTPSPEPSTSPTPAPTPEAPAGLEGDLLIVSPGFTAGELRELMKPQAIHIRDKTGQEVLSGRLATGMTAGDWTVVVLGDCNGSGTVTRADLQAAVDYTEADAVTPGYRAADLNSDGAVDGSDFLLFSVLLED